MESASNQKTSSYIQITTTVKSNILNIVYHIHIGYRTYMHFVTRSTLYPFQYNTLKCKQQTTTDIHIEYTLHLGQNRQEYLSSRQWIIVKSALIP
jgi:hypothetical protein